MASDAHPNNHSPRPAIALALIAALLIVLLRLLGPWDILDNDQLRPLSYILDIIRNNNWIVQHDWTGEVASKPPLYAWVGALPALLTNRVGPLELAIPSAIGVLIGAIAIALAAARVLGSRAACIATIAFIATPLMVKQTTLARTDGLYAGLTTAAALLAYRAWTTRKGWWEFWLIAALATITKGPLAIVLALAGLLFIRRARPHPDGPRRSERAEHAMGIVLFIAIAVGWFAAAWIHEGQPFIDKVLGRELFGHVTGQSKEHLDDASALEALVHWLVGLFKPTLYLLSRAAPWSIIAAYAIIRVFRSPADDGPRRHLERFCAGWLIIGLAIFSVVPHQRADLLSPIWAPGAILTASCLAARAAAWSRRRAQAMGGVALASTAVFVVAAHWFKPIDPRHQHIQDALAESTARGIPPAMIATLDGPYFFTALTNIHTPRLTVDQAVRLLSAGAPAFVSTNDPDALVREVRAGGRRAHIVVRTDAVSIVSNLTDPDKARSVATLCDRLRIETAGCTLGPPRLGTLIIEHATDAPAVVAIQNQTDSPRTINWRATTGEHGAITIAPLAEQIITLQPE